MLIVAGYLQVAAQERAEYQERAKKATALARAAPGCLEFVQAPDPIEADRIVIYERWESEQEVLACRNGDPEPVPAPLPDVLGAERTALRDLRCRTRVAAVHPLPETHLNAARRRTLRAHDSRLERASRGRLTLSRDRVYAEQARRYPGFADYERRTSGIRTIPVLELTRA